MTIAQRIRHRLRTVFSLDTKALSIMRVLLGGVLIIDFLERLRYFEAFYTNSGIVSLDLVATNSFLDSLRSIYTISDDPIVLGTLLVVHGAVLIAFTVGFQTRVMTVLAWIFTVSLQSRNIWILNGGDTLLRLFLFWSMFIPLGYHLSIDARRSTKNSTTKWFSSEAPERIFSVATIGFIVQICLVYLISYFLKTDAIWTTTYDAVYYAMSLDAFRTPLGDSIYEHQELMKRITMLTYLLEGFGVYLLLVPVKNFRARTVACVLFIGFHIGLIVSMHIGPFPWIAIVYWIGVLPVSELIRSLNSRQGRQASPITNDPLHWSVQAFLALVLTYIVCRNIRTLDFDRHSQWFPYSINRIGFILKIEQHWNMFAPYPTMDDGRYEIVGTRSNGSTQLMTGDEIGILYSDQPNDKRRYVNEKRHKLYATMRLRDNAFLREPYLDRLCNQHSDIESFEMTFMEEFTLLDYETKPIRPVSLASFSCITYK